MKSSLKKYQWMHFVMVSFGLLLFSSSVSSQAQPDDTETARTLSLGTGARSSAESTAALLQNPAGLSKKNVYHIEAVTAYETARDRWTVTASAVDSVTTSVAAGFSFRTMFGKKAYTGFDTRLGLAMGLFDWFRLGLGARYLKLSQSQGSNSEKVHAFTLDASAQLEPIPRLNLSFLSYNLVPTKSTLAPTRLGGGVSYNMERNFVVGADVLADLNSFARTTVFVGGGAQYFIRGMVPLSAGYAFDSGHDVHRITGGVGFDYESFDTHFSFRQEINQEKETFILISFNYHLK